MSIKDLFDNKLDINKLAPGSKKDSFSAAESGENVHQKREDQERFVPHIDYSEPANFVTYGSARLYYESALTRITDYYPYDGSQAEINKFLNESLDIERYILKHKYPSSTGYITLARDGYAVSEVIDDYGVPTTNEYIELKGGPGTGSATSTSMKNLMPSPENSSYKNSNIYDTDIYKSNNLPSNYGHGSRQSNLRANFDDGVTVEFWMKTGSIHNRNTSGRQVIFDAWNNKANTHADYARLTIELTGTTNIAGAAKDPFIVTIQSGANQPRTIERMIGLGATSLHTSMGDWNHYALRFYNTGSQKQILKSELYVNGRFSDSGSFSPYALTHSLELSSTASTDWYVRNDTNRYTSYKRLQGWWKLEDPRGEYVIDWSQNSRTGSYASSSYKPAASSKTPSAYIQTASADFDSALYGVNIGDASLWNGIIGTNQTASNSPKFTISARVRKTGDGGGGYGRIIDFGLKDISLYTNSNNRLKFAVRWKSADGSSGQVVYRTPTDSITNDTWEHVLVTYDAAHAPRSGSNEDGSAFSDQLSGSLPRIYVNGTEKTVELESGAPTGSFFGIVNQNCVIGNVSQRDRNWEGEIADVAVWDIVLDHNDIKALGHAQDYRQPFTRIPELNDKEMKARIGALITNPISSSAPAGAGRLSGSLDEFRYWKSARSAKQVGHYWFDQVRGGANSDISNADLGVYYKFNEGITGDTGTDSIVLDYAGRATNGVWTGYASNSRNTGSAIVSASAAAKEFEDPIIRTNHPDYLNLKSVLVQTGSSYDYTNNASMISMVPGWIQDEESEKDNSDLRYIAHVMGAYFDKLKLQIKEISKLKHINYPSSSHKPYPLAEHLPQSLGLYTPELFIDSNVLEKFMNRSEDTLFEADLDETKNIIYHNLYNNLAHIYKTKGTETAVRNIMNIFNIDENVMTLKVKSNNTEYELRNNLVLRKLNKNFLNFNTTENSRAIVYNRSASFSGLDNSAVSGSINGHLNQEPYGLTYEGNFMFPIYDNNRSELTRDSDYNTVSLFGFVQIASGDTDREKGTDTTKNEDDQATLKIQAVRESEGSRDAYFRLSSSFATASINFQLTSSTVFDLYNNEMWNLSVRVKPKKYPYAPFVSGSGDGTYEVVFSGFNPHAPGQFDSFRLTHDLTGTVAKHLIRARKRPFVGADRSNLTGNVVYPSDVCVSSISYWLKYLNDDDLIQHAFDLENIGTSGSYKAISVLDTSLFGFNPTNADTLVFNWNFRNVTGSDTQGNFVVQDFSSGSATLAERQDLGWVGEISKYQYTGYGYGFGNSSTTVVDRKSVNTYKFIDPEAVISSDMVQLFSDDDVLFPNLRRTETVPSYQYSLEKSLSNAISEEMLDFFAGAVDFQNIIGRPVNRYRGRYKAMEHLRETFFRRVKEVATVEKFIEYYKWYDEALTKVLQQFMPASADFADGITNVIESHVLERNKYKSKLNIIDSDTFWRVYEPVVPAVGGGGSDGVADTSIPSPPESPRPTAKGTGYWLKRAESKQSEISSNDTNVDTQRDKFKEIIFTKPVVSSSAGLPKLMTTDNQRYMSNKYGARTRGAGLRAMEIQFDETEKVKQKIQGGLNNKNTRNHDFTLTSLRPAGPVGKEDNLFLPQNVLIGFTSQSVGTRENINISWPDNFIRKRTKTFTVHNGHDWEDGLGYANRKSTFAFPFSVLSSSVELASGYNKQVVERVGSNIEITNLHIDGYGLTQEVPMQGPFTEYAVGGHQSRHIAINDGTDTPESRAEAWRILLGTCGTGSIPSGAIGMVGPDYPPPEYNPPAGTVPYPYKPFQKAYLYRDQIAKRPVNIRNINQIQNNKTVLGNYQENYQVFHSFGAYNNPRGLVENQPVLPLNEYTESARYTTNIRTYLDRHRGAQNHQTYIDDYSTSYLTGATNKSVIVCRFSHGPGGPEVETRGFQDFKASEFSVYNSKNYRNLSVIKPSQGPSGSISEPHGGTPTTSRVSDIHGADYGLRSHLSRHTARFGRDSNLVSTPGASYVESPGFHKIHRNNREGYTPVYGFTSSNIPDTGLINSKDVEFENGRGLCAVVANQTKRRERVFDAVHADSNSDSVLYTYSCWIRTTINSGQRIFEFGRSGTSADIIHALEKTSGNELKYYFMTTDGHGTFNDSNYKTVDAVMSASNWTHIVLTVSGAHGSMPVGGSAGNTSAGKGGGPTVKIYVNGESKDLYFPGSSCHAYWPTSSTDYSNFRGFGTDFAYPVMFFGKINNISGFEFVGDVDEMSLHSTALTDAEVLALYNGGAPQNLTQSGIEGSSSLLSWWRMGDHPDDDMSGEDAAVTSPFSASNGNIIIDVKNAANLHFTAQRHTPADNSLLKVSTGSTSLTGQPPDTRLVESITGYNKKPLRDNYYVQRPIPQSDRQYRWLSSSVVDVGNTKYSRYQAYGREQMDRFPFRSSSSGLFTTPYWEFVSASNATTGSFYQPPMLNIIVTDGIVDKGWAHINPISKELQARYMTLGPGRRDTAADQVLAYGNWTQLNTDLVGVGRPDPSPDYLNQLLTKRGSKYGWGWNKFHQNDHPLLRIQRENNLLVINDNDPDEPAANTAFHLYPVSMKGRTMLINITGNVVEPGRPEMTPTSMTYRVTNTNENIFFAQPQMNDIADIHFDEIEKSYREVLNFGKTGRFGLNWLLYSQNIFPSLRNEFVSGTERPGYDNLYWRDTWGGAETRTATANKPIPGNTRIALGTSSVTQNSFGAPTISQSSWLLDPLMSFMTRSYIEQYQQTGTTEYNQRRTQRRDFAGELQNTYYRSFMGQPPPWMRIGALYARASAIGTSRSVAAPTGPRISQTGSLEGYSASFEYNQRVEVIGAGEALWEAGTQAGILVRKNKTAELEFQPEPSVPWWNDYDSFKGDLKLKARGFAVVPEYRISEQMAAYHKNGFDPRRAIKAGNSDGFLEIVGSGQHADSTVDPISSSQVDFYKDYSNSDFLENFLNIEKESLLNAKEIRLSCTGAIRYNAYKGFYPAQRTLDLVSQFSRSFYKALILSQSVTSPSGLWDYWAYGSGISANKLANIEGFMKNLTDPIFSPGILFNSIKAGMAVDYPIVHDGTKMKYAHYGNEENKSHNWALTITGSTDEATNSGTSAFPIGSASTGYRGGMFWDRRIPFEAIIRPKSFIPDFTYLNMEAHPSMSYMRRTSTSTGITYKYESTASMSDVGDDLYSLMARNFFGEVPSFFLKESAMTSLQSNTVTNDLRFSAGEVYMTRIKLRRSHNGARTYQYEVDSFLRSPSSNAGEIGTGLVGIVGLNSGYGQYGCRSYLSASSSDPTVRVNEAGTPILLQDEFPLPQDPKMNPDFRETFTMYSRPSAFGPPVAGRPTGSWATRRIIATGSTNEPKHGVYTASFEKAAFDSFSGFNPAFTPPYTNGEAWVDLIFRPSSSIAYDLERILAETTAVCWRFDAGPPVRRSGSGDFMNTQPIPGIPLLIPVQQLSGTNAGKINEYSPQSDNTVPSPYDGLRINVNSMQLTSSIDIFGVERILEQQTDAKGQKAGRVTNKTVGHKWIIRPKWETPMLNFADSGPHVIGTDENDETVNLSVPVYASASVPRGMWHQFGIQPHAPDIGVFMEIGEIPKQWLKNHYMILNTGSVYNNFDVANGRQITRKVKSLSKLCGFNRNNNQVRLGDLKESMTVREAVVAIPYIQMPVPKKTLRRLKRKPKNTKEQTIKKFIEIPKPRWHHAIRGEGTLDTAGVSIRRLSRAMENYVFPPQFDARHNHRVKPIAMYVFEFEYTFDQDDLSYIWQNLAPRNFKKLQFQSSTVSHNLTNNELINEEILSHDNLRWMVFKVKQRAKSDYYDLLVEQAGGATSKIKERIPARSKYIAQYNWPYDYLSFVELIKMDVDILFRKDKTVKKKKQ